MKTRILIYGAGAIGSIFAGKLHMAGYEVTILARGHRYDEIIKSGIVLENAITGVIENHAVPCIRQLKTDDIYEYIIVVVQYHQLDEILPVLGKNKSSNMVFVVNTPLGYDRYAAAVGKERVMIGFPSAGGERKDGRVTYFLGTGIARAMQTTTFGEIDGRKTERLVRLVQVFRKAGFQPTVSGKMDHWQKTHLALVIPIARALYLFDSDNYKLARSPITIRKMILATREGFNALKASGIRVTPWKLNYYYVPIWLLVLAFKALFGTRIAEFAMAKHTIVAKQEMEMLEKEFLNICRGMDFKNWSDMG
jgi:2-dehydropantoate 2-reductase